LPLFELPPQPAINPTMETIATNVTAIPTLFIIQNLL
jgi:hypothetical protein